MSHEQLTGPMSALGRPELTDDPSRTVGVLLSHGFTGSPASVRPWGRFLAESGYAVEAPLLPGHGTTWQEMNTTRWEDWYAAVDRSLERLLAANDEVVLAGLSMGGALMLRLAADRPERIRGLVLVNPAVASTNKQLLAVPVLKHLVGSVDAIGNDIKKPGVREHAYDRTPLRALHSMMQGWQALRRDLPRVTAPIRMFRSETDHIVDPSSARIIRATVSSRVITETVLRDSFHVATLDHDAPRIFEESLDFIRTLGPAD